MDLTLRDINVTVQQLPRMLTYPWEGSGIWLVDMLDQKVPFPMDFCATLEACLSYSSSTLMSV
jgi:hypothetical protein